MFFFWLWKIEASFMTHVPCPPVKITPAVFQHCSIIICTANKNNGACGEETRQTKREKEKNVFLDGNTCSSILYTYIISFFPFRLLCRVPYLIQLKTLKIHSHRKILMGFQQQSNLAIFNFSLMALFASCPTKGHHCMDSPCVGGNWAQI